MAEVGNLVVKMSMDHASLSRQLKIVQNDFKAAAVKLGDFGKSTEGLGLRSDSLTKQLAIQRQQVQALEAAIKKSAEIKGADAKATQLLEVNLSRVKAQMASTEAELGKVTTELERQGNKWQQLSTKMQETGQKMSDMGDKIAGTGKSLSMTVTAPIVAAGAAAFKFGADLEDAVGATDQVFSRQSQAMQEWAGSLKSYYGIAEGEALEYANMMGSMLQNIGQLSQEEAAKQSQTLITLAGDLTAMFGGTTKDAIRALTGALKGNNSMLDNYGMAINEATIKSKALEMGLIAESKELDLASKQAATLALIMEQTAAAQGQAAREADGASGTLRSLSAELKDIASDFGKILLPIITPLIAKLRDLVKSFSEMSPATQKTIVTIAAFAAAIGPLLVIVGKVISGFGTVIAVVGKLSAALPVLGRALMFLAANPIGLVITGIGLLIAGGVALYKNWDKVKAWGIMKWSELKTAILMIISSILSAMEKLYGWIPKIGDSVRAAGAAARSALAEEAVKMEQARAAFDDIRGKSTSVGAFRQLDQESRNAAQSMGGLGVAVDDTAFAFDGLGGAASGAGGKMSAAAEKVKTAWVGTADAVRNALGIMQSQHEAEILRAEMAGDKVAVLRLKHGQLNEELEKQKQVVAATRAEVDKAIKAGVLEGETQEDLAKRVDELNKKLADEEKAQANLEKQVYDASEAMKAQGQSANDLVAELKKVSDTYYSDLAKALEEYQAKVKETNDSLRKDTEALQRDLESKLDDIRAKGADRERQVTEQFQRELENRTRALTNFIGLFEEIANRQVSGDTLLRNLEGQVEAFDDWQKNIQALAARGIDDGLLQELREMGPKAGPEIAALNTLTDEQLTQYAALWKQKQEQAKKEATAQLAQQRAEMNQQLSDIRQDTQNQLEQQRQEVARKLTEMQAKAKEELEKYKQEWEKKNEEIRKNTEKNIKDIHDKFNDLVGKSTGYGISLMENFMDGIDSRMPALISKLESVAAMIDSYMPHSPAKRGPLKRIMEWGPALVGSLTEGIKRSLPSLENVTARMAMLSPGALQPAVANSYSSSSTIYHQGGNTFYITVQDGEDLLRTLHKAGVRVSYG